MPFSYGGHPAFAVEDFDVLRPELSFNKQTKTYSLQNHLVDFENVVDIFQANEKIELTHDHFKDDAWIIANDSTPNEYNLRVNPQHEIKLTTNGNPFTGIWSSYPKLGDFVAVEPWWGVADTTDTTGDLYTKKGIQILDPNQKTNFNYSITFA
jgi:galactose mutarotase-like enzyme